MAHDLDPEVKEHSGEGADRYRALCEEALAAAGLHLAEGHKLWAKYRCGCAEAMPGKGWVGGTADGCGGVAGGWRWQLWALACWELAEAVKGVSTPLDAQYSRLRERA